MKHACMHACMCGFIQISHNFMHTLAHVWPNEVCLSFQTDLVGASCLTNKQTRCHVYSSTVLIMSI